MALGSCLFIEFAGFQNLKNTRNGLYGKILTKKEPDRTLEFT